MSHKKIYLALAVFALLSIGVAVAEQGSSVPVKTGGVSVGVVLDFDIIVNSTPDETAYDDFEVFPISTDSDLVNVTSVGNSSGGVVSNSTAGCFNRCLIVVDNLGNRKRVNASEVSSRAGYVVSHNKNLWVSQNSERISSTLNLNLRSRR